MNYYKLLRADGRTPQGYGTWPLPTDDGPGEWLPKVTGPLVACENGYHVMRAKDVLDWIKSDCQLYRVEHKGRVLNSTNKVVLRQARAIAPVTTWNDRTLRIFAADCAERVLPLYEAKYPRNGRPRKAIEAARLFADGRITADELGAAKCAAASAAFAADAASADAADAAASAAAYAAAYADERAWQASHLAKLLGID